MKRWHAACIVAVLLGVACDNSVPQQLVVTELSWVRSIDVIVTETKTEEAWEIPPGGVEKSRAEKVHHYRDVWVGKTPSMCYNWQSGDFEFCLEDVYRKEPVEALWYTYEIDRDRVARMVTASKRDRTPLWPEVTLGHRERLGKRTELYRVTFFDGHGGYYDHETPDLGEWLEYHEEGRRFYARVDPDTKRVARFTDLEIR